MTSSSPVAPHGPALVIGANGYLGSHVTRHLVEAGQDVRVMVREGAKTVGIDDLIDDGAVTRFTGDIWNAEVLREAMTGCDVVYYCVVDTRGWLRDPAPLFRTNVDGTRHVLDIATEPAVAAGLKKFVSLHESPYHGLNFCQGTVSEMLRDPNKEIHDIIRYFGSRKKIFNVHFRNIEGNFGNFRETYPDNGSVNMIDAIKTYQEVGYEYMLMPDHVPQIPGDTKGAQAFAYAFGYIQALVQMLG